MGAERRTCQGLPLGPEAVSKAYIRVLEVLTSCGEHAGGVPQSAGQGVSSAIHGLAGLERQGRRLTASTGWGR